MDLNTLMAQAEKMKGSMASAMEKVEVEGESGGGMVRVRLNGRREVVSLHIDPETARGEDTAFLQDLIIAAFNSASRKVDEALMSQMGSLLTQFKME